MNKVIYLMFFALLTNVTWSQKLYVGSGAAILILPGTVLVAENEVEFDAAGRLTTT
jgi:hypothetical protein